MEIKIKIYHLKDSNYNINLDLDPEPDNKQSTHTTAKTELGAVRRPDADRLKILKHPELAEEEKATEKVMDSLDL